ncbi:flagellar operon protein (TIGR03826 family) [Gracilibacillus halotolerans]|uniref:Flagellar operon protein (TIGR03826 family) n=1 Tax=Gracilibacillus halotolerans TaxID=74386 RepID=A0A841RIH1_9BACI|nr:TIGR03826 family flagellar region protein [Gracilibacillus halotolerans]MBB6512279.1 flagellar operon protein (TIGR03826 family) [Gracilibacillus halotolerans]
MAQLANCTRCGKLYAKTVKDVCPDCVKEYEKMFEIVYTFLRKRENRQATIPEIVEATGVEEKVILQFVKEKRLRQSQFPNLSYPCERCGNPIVEGKLCSSCVGNLQSELEKHQEEDKRKREEAAKTRTYFTRD